MPIDPMARKFRLCLDPNILSKIGYDAVQSAGLDDLLPDGGAPGKPAGPSRLPPLLVRRQPRQSLLHSLDLIPLTQYTWIVLVKLKFGSFANMFGMKFIHT
mgnify:CR=1 FL=1